MGAIFTLMVEALGSSETWDLTRATRCHMPEDGNVAELFL
jgi:hypothetical protein